MGGAPERWNPPPPSPRAAEVAEERVPAAGAEASAAGRSVEEAALTTEAPTSAAGALASAAVAVIGAAAAPPEPSRMRKWGFSSLRWVAFSPGIPDFEGQELNLAFSSTGWRRPSLPSRLLRRLGRTCPCPRGGARREHSRSAGSAMVKTEPPRDTTVATVSWQEVAATAAVTTAATAASTVPPVPAPAAGGWVAVVEIPDDDAPPPGWGKWENWPTPAPEPAAGVLVMGGWLRDAATSDARC
jgi:hypothetical protein